MNFLIIASLLSVAVATLCPQEAIITKTTPYNSKLALYQKFPLLYKLRAKICQAACDKLKGLETETSKVKILSFPPPPPAPCAVAPPAPIPCEVVAPSAPVPCEVVAPSPVPCEAVAPPPMEVPCGECAECKTCQKMTPEIWHLITTLGGLGSLPGGCSCGQ